MADNLHRDPSDAAPGLIYEVVTPSDVTNFTRGFCRALYVGVTGNITLIDAAGQARLFSNVPVGVFPIGCSRVNATATTATNIVAIY